MKNTDFEFHTMLPSEQAAVEPLILNLYSNDGVDLHHHMTHQQIKHTLERSITHPESLTIDVFKHNGEIFGYALLYSFWSNEYGGLVLTIDELYVSPKFRNRGIATQYLQALGNRDVRHVLLSLEVLPGNYQAEKLYSRLGFVENNRTFMKKNLTREIQ